MEQYLNVPLYTFRVYCDGGHLFSALIPEREAKEALEFTKHNPLFSFYFADPHNNLFEAAIESHKISAVMCMSATPRIIKNDSGTLRVSVYDQKKEKPVKTVKPKSVGRVLRKGHK